MDSLISKKAIYELQEYFVGTTLRTIEQELDAAGITCNEAFQPKVSGQRRKLFQQYLCTVDLIKPREVRKVLDVFGNVLVHLEATLANKDATDKEKAQQSFTTLCKILQRDGYEYHDGMVVSAGRGIGLEELQDKISPLELPHLQQQIERLRKAADEDSWLAIGTAKELIETTCKTILRERSVEVAGKPEMPELLKATREALQLLPSNVPNAAKGADTIRRLLSNLGTIAQNLAELRRDYGTGHGQDGRVTGLHARHARLAVNSAVTLVTFLIETHMAKGRLSDA